MAADGHARALTSIPFGTAQMGGNSVRTGSGSNGVDRAFVALLVVEILVILVFAWRSWLWLGWSKIGPDAFPGSPDAAYLYYACQRGAIWSARLLVCTWIAVVSLVAIRWKSSSDRRVGPALTSTLPDPLESVDGRNC
jgi:hypothetical protein